MSIAPANGNGSVRISPAIWNGIVLVALLGMMAWIGSWASAEIRDARSTNVSQGNQLTNHEVRITNAEANAQRIDAKLDRILDRVEK